MMVARIILRGGYELRMGLDQDGDGMVTLLEVAENRGRLGLGYKPTNTNKRRISLERKEKCSAYLQGREPQLERVPICHISKSFRNVGWMYVSQVAMLKEEVGDDLPN